MITLLHSLPTGRVTLGVLVACLVSFGCQKPKAAPQAPPPPTVSVAKPSMQKVQPYYEYNGYLDAIETVQVKARVKGVIEKIAFTEGAEIKKGDLLYVIDPREYVAAEAKAKADIKKAEADAANAKAQMHLAQAEVDRIARLSSTGAVSQSEYDKALGTLASYKAQQDVAFANRDAGEAALQTARLDIEYTQIKAPIDGRINRTLVTAGNLVGQNETTLLTTILRMNELYVYFDTAERDLIEFHRSAKNELTPLEIKIAVTGEEGYPHIGFIDFRENRVETSTGTVRVRGRVKNPVVASDNVRLLYPGLYSRVQVPSGQQRIMPVIPEDALMTGQEGRFVYVLMKDNMVKKQSVKVMQQPYWRVSSANPKAPAWQLSAPTNPPAAPPAGAPPAGTPGAGGPPPGPPPGPLPVLSMVAIEEGLSPDDRVIVNGLTKVRPGSPVNPEDRHLIPPVATPTKK
jgi:multidrug efflux system membrane fusion protein